MASDEFPLYRLRFSYSDFRKLSEEEQLFFVRLAQIADDLRHVFYLSVAAERGTHSASSDERKLAMHQLLFCVRLIYSILNEGWSVIDCDWNGRQLAKTWYSRLSDKGRHALAFLGKYFAQENLSRTIRNEFGFHYAPEPLRESMAHIPEKAAEIITGMRSANVFYTLAEEIRAIALLQAAHRGRAAKQWDETVTEEQIRAAAIELYEAYRPVRNAFDDFANDVLVTVVKSLGPKTEKFSPPHVTKFSEMSPVLFVEEPKGAQLR